MELNTTTNNDTNDAGFCQDDATLEMFVKISDLLEGPVLVRVLT